MFVTSKDAEWFVFLVSLLWIIQVPKLVLVESVFCVTFKLLTTRIRTNLAQIKKLNNIRIFHQNIQGLSFKMESLQIVLDEILPAIVVLTKHKMKLYKIDRLKIIS